MAAQLERIAKIASNRRIIFACIGFVLFFTMTGLAQAAVSGGWSQVSATKKEAVNAADFAIKAEEKTMQDRKNGKPEKLELVEILAVKEQVVAGMNYRLTLKVKLNGKEKRAEATVWWQAWRKPDPYRLTSWKWLD